MEAVIEIGLMDEGMLMIGSDSDWCYTARARGWEVWYVAEAEVVHEAGVSSKPTAAMQPIFKNDMDYWRDKWIGSALHTRLFAEFAPKGTPMVQGSFQIG
jgi:GT2 family glycosyltransferase